MVEPHTLTFDMSHIAQQYILCVLAIVNGDRSNARALAGIFECEVNLPRFNL